MNDLILLLLNDIICKKIFTDIEGKYRLIRHLKANILILSCNYEFSAVKFELIRFASVYPTYTEKVQVERDVKLTRPAEVHGVTARLGKWCRRARGR